MATDPPVAPTSALPRTPLPRVAVTADDPLTLDVDALVVPAFRGGFDAPSTVAVLDELGLSEVPRDASFRGDVGEVLHLAAPGLPAGRVTIVGLGRMDALSDETLRRAAGAATRALATTAGEVALTLPLVHPGDGPLQATAEGALLGAYRYLDARTDATPTRLTAVTLVVPSGAVADAPRVLDRAVAHARAQAIARDLTNCPPDRLGPVEFAQVAVDLLDDRIDVEVWDEHRLAEERCHGHLAVGGGSARPPRLVRLSWTPDTPVAKVAFVGKGITFDTGGISLKPSASMETMKKDMAGAGAILALFAVLPDLDLPVAVTAELCLAENLPSGSAQRPSDVITYRDGTTVEVINTDAEGRLVMADGLCLAAEDDDVDAIIDVATLTGACSVAVGRRAFGVFGNDDDLLRQILSAAEDAGEDAWHLPIWEDLRANLDSDVADIDHLGRGDDAGATMAALFLREFVGTTPWVHLDIAGPSYVTKARHHLTTGGTGVPVRTLLRYLEAARG